MLHGWRLGTLYSSKMTTMVPRLDVSLFTATVVAAAGHLYYQRIWSSGSNLATRSVHTSVTEMISSSIQTPSGSITVLGSPLPITGLLFAAGWCPDCTDIVPKIGSVVSIDQTNEQQQLLNIVYVGSDDDEESLLQFKPSVLKHIPIAAETERSDLKRKFRTCAAKEMKSLGISERQNGIPTLILLDSFTGQVLSEKGVDDVMKYDIPDRIIDAWKQLLA